MEEDEEEKDIYEQDHQQKMRENDEIDSEEEGFMVGYTEDITQEEE